MSYAELTAFYQTPTFAAVALALYAHLAHLISGVVRSALLNTAEPRSPEQAEDAAYLTFVLLLFAGCGLAVTRFFVYQECPFGPAGLNFLGVSEPCVKGEFLIVRTLMNIIRHSLTFFGLIGSLLVVRVVVRVSRGGWGVLRPGIAWALALCLSGALFSYTITRIEYTDNRCGFAGCNPLDY